MINAMNRFIALFLYFKGFFPSFVLYTHKIMYFWQNFKKKMDRNG